MTERTPDADSCLGERVNPSTRLTKSVDIFAALGCLFYYVLPPHEWRTSVWRADRARGQHHAKPEVP